MIILKMCTTQTNHNYKFSLFLKLFYVFLSFGNFQYFGGYFFYFFGGIYLFLASKGKLIKLNINKFSLVNAIFFSLVITEISSLFSDLPFSYKLYSLKLTICFIFLYFFYSQLTKDCKYNNYFDNSIKYIEIGFLFHLFYIPFQFFLYSFFDIDINKLIFHDLLMCMENASFYRNMSSTICKWYPSGVTWHSAYLAPMFVISFFLFKNILIRFIVFFDSFVCGNLTCFIGVILCFMLLSMQSVYFKLKRKSIFHVSLRSFLIVLILVVFCFFCFEHLEQKIDYLISRIDFSDLDSSSLAHLSYYKLYFNILTINDFFSNLFGTGVSSSGFSITRINGQYSYLSHWVTESDFIDILVSRGLIGGALFYFFLFYIGYKGSKIDLRYLFLVIVIFFQGITYNIQFEYLFFLELFLYHSVRLKKNFWV